MNLPHGFMVQPRYAPSDQMSALVSHSLHRPLSSGAIVSGALGWSELLAQL
jgi:hypothetical protein